MRSNQKHYKTARQKTVLARLEKVKEPSEREKAEMAILRERIALAG
jgi:hypothetical protein